MSTANILLNDTDIDYSSNSVYIAEELYSLGSFHVYAFPGIENIPILNEEFKNTEKIEYESKIPLKDEEILESAKNFYKTNKETLLRKYQGKYIAILNNKVVGSGKDFSQLAKKVYEKYGYQTIYMPFVDEKKKVIRMRTPIIKRS